MTKPIELKTKEQRELWFKYKEDVDNHSSWKVKNQYFKDRNMDGWEEELKKIERDMREKMRILQIQQNKENYEKIQMNKEDEIVNLCIKRINNVIKYEKIKETRKKNKEMKPIRRSKRIKEKNEVEIIAIKSYEEILKEKLENAILQGNYIDLTI